MKGRKGTQVFSSLFPVLIRSFFLCLPSSEVCVFDCSDWQVCRDATCISHTLDRVPAVCVRTYLSCVWLRFVCVF